MITKQDIHNGYNNLKKCIDVYIKLHNVAFEASSDAPSTYSSMRESMDSRGCYVVYNGGDHGLLGEEYNIKFRAIHDHGHYVNVLSFKFDDERRLSDIQATELALIAWNNLGLTTWEVYVVKRIVQTEIAGQIDYYEKNKKYVDDQKEFVYGMFRV